MKYRKEIKRSFTGLVTVSIIDNKGSNHGLEFFHGFPFESEEGKLRRANKWADKLITLLEKYEH